MNRRILTQWVVPITVLILAIVAAWWFITQAPKAKRRPAVERKAVIVNTAPIEKGDYPVIIEAMGEIIPAREVEVRSRISGEIVHISNQLEPGGIVRKGEALARLDERDYQLQVRQREADLQKAKSALEIEKGRQVIARHELEMLQQTGALDDEDYSLALRQPQLKQAQAELANAEVLLEEAQLTLERTTIYAPWDALVLERTVSSGASISAQALIARLVDFREYRVKATLRADALHLLKFGTDPSRVTIPGMAGNPPVVGKLLQIDAELDPASRLVPVLITIPDPLGILKKPRKPELPSLILGDYRQLSIEGKTLPNVFKVSRNYLRNSSNLWVLRESALEIIPVNPLHQDRNHVYFHSDEITPEDRLITSNLSTPVAGMRLMEQTP